jgi:hypothetical protein
MNRDGRIDTETGKTWVDDPLSLCPYMLAGTDDATRAAQGDMPSLMAHAAPPQSAANPLNSKYCQHGFIGFAGSAGCKAGLGFDIFGTNSWCY